MDERPKPPLSAMEEQERAQILYKARHTTPLQRIEWLEQMRRLFLGIEAKREKKTDEHAKPVDECDTMK